MSARETARLAERPMTAAYTMAGTALELSADGDWNVACGWLDPAEPFLADHQPGGCPLLGTVGGLEILAAWMAAGEDAPGIVALEAVEAIRPIVFESSAPRRLTTRWRTHDGAGPARTIAAELSTPGDDGETVHLRCVFVAGEPVRPGHRNGPAARSLSYPRAVGADEIYQTFFHGPAFRVVARAQLNGTAMVSALASPLPRWSTTPGPTLIAPRLIEFGLQTAGLLQLALDGAMMIPRRIDRVDRYRTTDVDCAVPMFAVAERAGADPADPIDIRIVDHDDAVHIGIIGYRCVPLPFATDDTRLNALADRLRHSGSGSPT